MTDIFRLFDSYSRQARLYPALIALLPILLTILAWYPAVMTIGQLLLTLAVASGLFFWLADFSRSRGKKIEPRLLASWGGWPTTIWLRHRDTHLPADVKRRYHSFLSRWAGSGQLPTPEQEGASPTASDERYASAVMWLKEQCRGASFPLVERENAAYGFRRNMLGLRPIAIAIIALMLLFPAVSALVENGVDYPFATILDAYSNLQLAPVGAIVFCVITLAAWFFAINSGWVRVAGDQYARALLACCDSLRPGK